MDYEPSDLFGEPEQPDIQSDTEQDPQLIDYDEEEPGNRSDEAIEVPDPESKPAKVVKPKRVVKNPQPKLDPQRLMGARGIGILEKSFEDVKFRGKGYETDDLNILMKKLEHWTHRLFPKFTFDQTIKRIEKLGSKKGVQVQMKKLRHDMFNPITSETVEDDEDNVLRMGDDTENVDDPAPMIDIFDQLIGSTQTGQIENKTITSMTLSEEQKERIERNKRLAAERRLQRIKEQERKALEASNLNEQTSIPDISENTDNINGINKNSNEINTNKTQDLETTIHSTNSKLKSINRKENTSDLTNKISSDNHDCTFETTNPSENVNVSSKELEMMDIQEDSIENTNIDIQGDAEDGNLDLQNDVEKSNVNIQEDIANSNVQTHEDLTISNMNMEGSKEKSNAENCLLEEDALKMLED